MEQISSEKINQISEFIQQNFGIIYSEEKHRVLAMKTKKVMVKHRIESVTQLLSQIKGDKNPTLLQDFINGITINKTDFFREMPHFQFLIEQGGWIEKNNPSITEKQEIRAWSTACSTGEEAYTLGAVLKEVFGKKYTIQILATDIDTNVLKEAQRGIYKKEKVEEIPKMWRENYFYTIEENLYVGKNIKELITFRQFNLMNTYLFKSPFDIVFCRNVMIYFDRQTQRKLVENILNTMNVGGLLFIGHSEILLDKVDGLKCIKPSIYIKERAF